MTSRLIRFRLVVRLLWPLAAAVTGLAGIAILAMPVPATKSPAVKPPDTKPPAGTTPAVATPSAPTGRFGLPSTVGGVTTGAGPSLAPDSPIAPSPAVVRQPGPVVRLPQGGTARLVRREIGPDGTLPVPDGVSEATWWGASIAAHSGAIVLAGHVNWRSTTGPFAELWQAGIGEYVELVDEHGRSHRYRIIEVHTLSKDELPERAPNLFGPEGPHRVVLVTCGGRWVGGELGYEANRILVAHPG